MKRLVLSGLSLLLLTTATVPSAIAQTTALNSVTSTSTSTNQLTPFNLVSLAHRGYFQEQGIPGYSNFSAAYHLGRITAEDLVQAAVKSNRLDAELLTDQDYLSAVEAQLSGLANIN